MRWSQASVIIAQGKTVVVGDRCFREKNEDNLTSTNATGTNNAASYCRRRGCRLLLQMKFGVDTGWILAYIRKACDLFEPSEISCVDEFEGGVPGPLPLVPLHQPRLFLDRRHRGGRQCRKIIPFRLLILPPPMR